MPSLGTITLVGKSGTPYIFEIYNLNTVFNPVSAVYAFTRAEPSTSGIPYHTVLYVGQTGDLKSRIATHEKLQCVLSRGGNRICVRATPFEQDRLNIEKDLCQSNEPACNELLKSTPIRF